MTMSGERSSPKRFRVLLVEDDQNIVDTMTKLLGDNVDVVTCPSPERALRLLENVRFHLVCAELKMKEMNGIDLLDRVAKMPHHTSRLLLTGSEEYIASKEYGRHYVLLRPFNPERFVRIALQLSRLSEMKRSVNALAGTVTPAPPSTRRPSSMDMSAPISESTTGPGSVRPPSSASSSLGIQKRGGN